MQDPLHLPTSSKTLRAVLLSWYDAHRRELPWRAMPGKRPHPYHVLVSEVMLQQTTASTVRKRFPAFIARFPTIDSLATATLDDVLHAWQGLGYYRRARSLHAASRVIVERYGSVVPSTIAELKTLPGIGDYTASAVAAIAYRRPTIPVDSNVRRVLSRLAAVEVPAGRIATAVRPLAGALASLSRPDDTAQALMELGALLCRPRAPGCGACPWRPHCRAAAELRTATLPLRAPPKQKRLLHTTVFLLRRRDGAILLRRRPDQGPLAGLVELPGTPWSEKASDRHPSWAWDCETVPGEVEHVFTHLRLRARLVCGRSDEPRDGFWHPPEQLGTLALPTLTRKLLRHGGIAC